MKLSRLFHGKVVSHGFVPNDPTAWMRHLAALDGKDATASIEKRRKVRSLDQNAWFHGCVLPMLADAAGYDNDAMKEALKWEFLRVEPTEKGKLPTVRGTHELSTVEFSDFCERCIRLAAEFYELVIPDPYYTGMELK